jgi:hypothetical protein
VRRGGKMRQRDYLTLRANLSVYYKIISKAELGTTFA